MSDSAKAEQFKQRGNAYYKNEDYQEAVRFYTQAISLCPEEGAYYGNRSAAWLMLKEYRRCVSDCIEGIKREASVGQMDKLRQRHASALAATGAFDEASAVLEEALQLKGREGNANMVSALEQQRDKLLQAGECVQNGSASLDKGEFSRAKRLFQSAQTYGMTEAPVVLLGMARACMGLEDFEEASRSAQKVIAAGGQVGVEAYAIRAEALQALGATELAQKHLLAALQLDPDNSDLQGKLKALRRNIAETARIRELIDKAMNARKFDEAIAACGQGMNIDRHVKKLMAEFHCKRAKAYSMLAKVQLRGGGTSGEASGSSGGGEGTSDPQELGQASYKRCLQDANASIYYDSSEAALPAIFLKVEALQGLDRYQEAVDQVKCPPSLVYLFSGNTRFLCRIRAVGGLLQKWPRRRQPLRTREAQGGPALAKEVEASGLLQAPRLHARRALVGEGDQDLLSQSRTEVAPRQTQFCQRGAAEGGGGEVQGDIGCARPANGPPQEGAVRPGLRPRGNRTADGNEEPTGKPWGRGVRGEGPRRVRPTWRIFLMIVYLWRRSWRDNISCTMKESIFVAEIIHI